MEKCCWQDTFAFTASSRSKQIIRTENFAVRWNLSTRSFEVAKGSAEPWTWPTVHFADLVSLCRAIVDLRVGADDVLAGEGTLCGRKAAATLKESESNQRLTLSIQRCSGGDDDDGESGFGGGGESGSKLALDK